MKQNKFNFGGIRYRLERAKQHLPIILANQAQSFFVASWRKQGWDDGGIKKWEKPKRMRGSSRAAKRPILVKTGRLRRAVSSSIRQRSFDKIRLVVDVPYAITHNEGGTSLIPAMEKVLNFSKKGRFSKMAKANYAKKVVIPAHRIQVPKRQFMGDSRTLRNMQIKTINKNIDAIWQA